LVFLGVVVLGAALATVVALGATSKALDEVAGEHLEVVEEAGKRRLAGASRRGARLDSGVVVGAPQDAAADAAHQPPGESGEVERLPSGPLAPARIEILTVEKQSDFHGSFPFWARILAPQKTIRSPKKRVCCEAIAGPASHTVAVVARLGAN